MFSLKETELQKEYQKLGFVEEKECPRENAATNRSSEDSVVHNPLRSPPPVEKYRNSDIPNDSRNSSLNERIRGETSYHTSYIFLLLTVIFHSVLYCTALQRIKAFECLEGPRRFPPVAMNVVLGRTL